LPNSKQEIRIKYRWQAIDQENEAMEKAKKGKKSLNVLMEIHLNNY
jgi:hypothetical protein